MKFASFNFIVFGIHFSKHLVVFIERANENFVCEMGKLKIPFYFVYDKK